MTRVGSTDLSIFTSNRIILEKMLKVRYKAALKVSYQQFLLSNFSSYFRRLSILTDNTVLSKSD